MRKNLYMFTIAILSVAGLLSIFSCEKDDQNNNGRKPYAWVVGEADSTGYGMILFSPDGGITWMRQGQGNSFLSGVYLAGVWAVDEYNVWVIGNGNTILRSTDGGTVWSRIDVPGGDPESNLASISLSGKQNIWISGSRGKIYHSNDDGSTWQVFTFDYCSECLFQGIHAVNSQIVYAAGGIQNRGLIVRTLNGGQNWDTIAPPDHYNQHGNWIGVKATDAEHVVVYGGKSRYTFTTDGGQTWTNDSIPGTGGIDGADINCLSMLDDQTWWGAFDFDGIFLTENSGSGWIKQPSTGPAGMFLVGIDVFDRQNAIITGMSSVSINGKILYTTDGGNTWELSLTSRAWLNKVSFIKY